MLLEASLTDKALRLSTFSAVIMKVVFGIDAVDDGDEIIDIVDAALEWIGEALVPGKYLVDVFPILQHVPPWVPGATVQRLAVRWRSTVARLKEVPYRRAKAAMVSATRLTPRTWHGMANRLNSTVLRRAERRRRVWLSS